ncbi:AAA family ATPase [Pseudalkalibacillus berkeleyi]|uniref:AAA family ATPase n=1 Tax=Pseudalkalibacillus berkeleyi TaxID=1069813 RepID=A0ABS9H6Z3_9BACL|nr:AAA family ATPase [Pseudalkalibacillus berkeleyi]MCF6139553.1 AAA family ATPase [Pseudalkalibacillus berkeleyi]
MSQMKAIIITENETIQHSLIEILEAHEIEAEVNIEWKRSFAQANYTFYFIDYKSLKMIEEFTAPASSFIIGMSSERSFDEGRAWMRAGAYDVVVYPDEQSRLNDIISSVKGKVEKQKESFGDTTFGGGQVNAFYSAKGGSGKTLMASMIAQSLQIHHDKRVILIDLSAQFGGLETVYGVKDSRSYLDLQPVMQELSLNHIENVATKDEETGNYILLGPANPAKAEETSEELITKIIRTCRAHFDHVILDLPTAINTISFAGLNEATKIHYILNPDSLSLRSYKHANALFERFQLGNRGSLSILLNRVHPKSELGQKDVSKLIGKEIDASIRSDYFALQPYLNLGDSFYKKEKDKGQFKPAKDVRSYVEKVLL